MEFSFSLTIKHQKKMYGATMKILKSGMTGKKISKNITLNGEFKMGSCGTMELEGNAPNGISDDTCRTPLREFWDKTSIRLEISFLVIRSLRTMIAL